MTNGNVATELADRIVRWVEEYWTEHEKPLLLSQLGGLENGEIATLTKQESGSLKAYLREHLEDRVRVIQHSSKFAVIGAIPAQAKIAEDISDDELIHRTSSPLTKHVAHYLPSVWRAFRKPIEDSKRRYLSVKAPFHFVDGTEEGKPEGLVEVDREFVAETNSDPIEIERKILSWVEGNKLEISLFQSKRRLSGQQLPANDLLSKLLVSLSEEDLRRISMPLDIVRKLRREQL